MYRCTCLLVLVFYSLFTFPRTTGSAMQSSKIRIISDGNSTQKQLYNFVRKRNKTISSKYLISLIEIYLNECKVESINHDIAFAQMCLETNFLKYTGVVTKSQNNFSGIGAINSWTRGNYFENKTIGVRAHIQHLKAYASRDFPVTEVVDPRYRYVKKASCIYLKDLSGKWATDISYGEKISRLIHILLSFSN